MEKEEYTQDMIEQIICNVIGYSQQNEPEDLLAKYNDNFYLSYFDRLKIDETIKKVPSHQKQLEISEFVRLFLSVISHRNDETLYLTISLNKLFKRIKEEANNEKGVRFSDFTSFLCNKISEGDPDLKVPMKQIPLQRMIPDTSKIRDIDINPPPILHKVQLQHPKITKDKTKKDKKLSQKKPISNFIYSPSLNSIITLGRLSSSITLYNPRDLHINYKIIPSTCKLMSKDVAILSIAYCEREQRIGSIINNIGIAFWEGSDGFVTEKVLGMGGGGVRGEFDVKSCGDKIYYLNLFQQWVTTDRECIYFWDIKEEKVTNVIRKQNSSCINDICQINHIRSLLVSYNLQQQANRLDKLKHPKAERADKHEQKQLILYQEGKKKSKLTLGNPGCHTIRYNPTTQLIICLGYQSNISIYEIDTKTFDINLVTQLQAHVSILTCVCNIPDTSMIISGDDVGCMKIWELNYMRCVQSIKIAKSLTEIECTGDMLIYADSRINTIPMDGVGGIGGPCGAKGGRNQRDQDEYGVYQFFRKEEESLWIITRKEAREININTGRIKNILVLCNNEQDISAAAQIYNGFIIGTSRGQMSKFTLDGQRKWKIPAHQGQIHSIKIDPQNHLIITIGSDNNTFIWPQKTITNSNEQGPRKRITFKNKDINLVEVCPYANLLLIGSTSDCELTVWNYDNLKLAYRFLFEAAVAGLLVLADKYSFVVSTVDGVLYVFSYVRKQAKLKINLTTKININSIPIQPCPTHPQQQSNPEPQPQPNIQCLAIQPPISSFKQTYVSKLCHCEDNNTIIGSTPTGHLYSLSPQNFIFNSNYRREYEPTPTLKRPMKQSFGEDVDGKQCVQCRVEDMTEGVGGDQGPRLQALWGRKVHKDGVYFLGVINLEKKYVCTLCVDGYFKLTELQEDNPVLVCSHKISFPLPVKWDIDVQNYCDLKNQIHEAIVVIDSILKNYSYQLTLKQQSSLNITQFMQKMITNTYPVKPPEKSAQILSSQYSRSDIKQLPHPQTSLKSLQAYKRLQLIKKQSQPQVLPKKLQPIYRYQTSNSEKQLIRNFLEPNYLPKLLNRNIPETCLRRGKEGGELDLVGRIEEGLVVGRDVRRERDKENKFNVSLGKSQLRIFDQGTFRKNTSVVVGRDQSFVRDKTVKQILGEINTKLHQYKKNRHRVKESYSTFVQSP